MKILCSGYLIRYPAGGFSWHHFQYLIGLKRLGHDVTYVEEYGWPNSCYDPVNDREQSDPHAGIAYFSSLLRGHDLNIPWCFLALDGTAHGMSRPQLAEHCRDCDLYISLSNINQIPETQSCRRRALVDTDPVYTQRNDFGAESDFSAYDVLFTYGENVHQPGCTMPTAGMQWLPTRQPVVLNLWPVVDGNRFASFTTVMGWYGEGQQDKARELEPYYTLPRQTGEPMEIAVGAPPESIAPLIEGGWRISEPRQVAGDLWSFQHFLQQSRAEFSVAKRGYVRTQSGWFSERSTGYLASGRPVIVQNTGFSQWLPTGEGVLAFRNPEEARAGIEDVNRRFDSHCRAARVLVEEFFAHHKVLSFLLERAFASDRSESSAIAQGAP